MFRLISSVLAFTTISFALSAFADLQVFPLRVVLSDRNRSSQISVRHRGLRPMRYRITTVFYKMGADGSMTPLEKTSSQDNAADSYFRYSPKQVVLEPNVEQVIRLMMRAPANLPDGEYRTHLRFEGVDEDEGKPGEASGTTAQSQMQLKARLAVAIPIIIRKGQPTLKVSLNDLKVTKTPDHKPAFSVELKKEGNAIAFGDFEVLSIPSGGAPRVIGTINGVSSYIDSRIVSFPLAEAPSVPGKLKIVFKKPVSEGAGVLAVSETELK